MNYNPNLIEQKLSIDEFEKDIATAGGNLYLTNYRIRYYKSGVYYSIRLSEISYVEYERRHLPQILTGAFYTAAFFLVIAIWKFYKDSESLNIWPAILIVMFGYLIYWVITIKTIKFSSSGGGIAITANSLSDPEIDRFIELAENAIFEFTTRKPIYKII